ncbi:MAG: glycosyltransferase [Actinobacteria bacterium]|nr:glycosyltransferase [Actinomycetota bacterium]
MRTVPRVSVVMPVLDGERFVAESIASVLRQTDDDLELIVVDDGSTDRTPELLAEFARADRRVCVLRRTHGGLTSALNAGFEAASAPFVARLDSDDVAVEDRLERQLAALNQRPSVGVIGGAVEMIDGEGRLLWTDPYPLEPDEIRQVIWKFCPVLHSAVMIRREAWQQAGGYREAFRRAEDYDLWFRVLERWDIANLAEPVVRYRVHADQVSVRFFREQAIAAVAARASARHRRDSGRDPAANRPTLDAATLRELGVSGEDVAREGASAHAWWALVLSRAGYSETSSALLKEAWAAARMAGSAGTLYELALTDARLQRERRRPLRMAHALMRAGRHRFGRDNTADEAR